MRRFFRRWYIRWVAFPIATFLVVHAVAVFVLATRFEARLDDLRDAGVPVDYDALQTPPVSDEDNAAPLLAEADAWWQAEKLEQRRPDILDAELPEDQWEPEELEEVRAWLRSGDPYVDLLARAAAKRHLRQELDWSEGTNMILRTIPQLQPAPAFIEERVRRAKRATSQQISELAVLLDLARKCERPFVLMTLVRWQIDWTVTRALVALSHRPGFDVRAARALLDPRLKKTMDHVALSRDALQGDRVGAIYMHRRWLDGVRPLTIIGRSDETHWLSFDRMSTTWLLRPVVYRGAMRTLDMFDRMLDLVDLPPAEAWPAAQAVADDYQSAADGLAGVLGTVPVTLFRERLRHTARIRVVRVGLALLQRRAETGVWPEDIEEALPLVDAETLKDPYADARLQYEPGVRLEARVPISPELLEGYLSEIGEERRVVWKFK